MWSDRVATTLRFNVDLTTRPCWYPPSAAGPSLALADWWQESAQSLPAGDIGLLLVYNWHCCNLASDVVDHIGQAICIGPGMQGRHCAGLGDCWWHQVSAEEAGESHADAYRQLSLQHLKRRMLLPELLVGMLRLQDPGAELGREFTGAVTET